MFSSIRIWFMDNIWDRLFPPDATPRLIMTGRELQRHRLGMELTKKQMAKLLHTSLYQYLEWENSGLRAPHDTEGPATVMIKLVQKLRADIDESKELLEELGYPKQL